MKARIATHALALAFAVWPLQAAWGCGANGAVVSQRETYAASLFGAATFVDLAVAVRPDRIDVDPWVTKAGEIEGEPDDDPMFGRKHREGRARHLLQMGAASIAFRSVERLKGEGATEFQLYGFWFRRPEPAPPRRPSLDPVTGRSIADALPLYEVWPTSFISMCAGSISARAGGRYLIFRDADGRLLSAEGIDSEILRGPVWGRAFEEIRTPDDPWLAAVRAATISGN